MDQVTSIVFGELTYDEGFPGLDRRGFFCQLSEGIVTSIYQDIPILCHFPIGIVTVPMHVSLGHNGSCPWAHSVCRTSCTSKGAILPSSIASFASTEKVSFPSQHDINVLPYRTRANHDVPVEESELSPSPSNRGRISCPFMSLNT